MLSYSAYCYWLWASGFDPWVGRFPAAILLPLIDLDGSARRNRQARVNTCRGALRPFQRLCLSSASISSSVEPPDQFPPLPVFLPLPAPADAACWVEAD